MVGAAFGRDRMTLPCQASLPFGHVAWPGAARLRRPRPLERQTWPAGFMSGPVPLVIANAQAAPARPGRTGAHPSSTVSALARLPGLPAPGRSFGRPRA